MRGATLNRAKCLLAIPCEFRVLLCCVCVCLRSHPIGGPFQVLHSIHFPRFLPSCEAAECVHGSRVLPMWARAAYLTDWNPGSSSRGLDGGGRGGWMELPGVARLAG